MCMEVLVDTIVYARKRSTNGLKMVEAAQYSRTHFQIKNE